MPQHTSQRRATESALWKLRAGCLRARESRCRGRWAVFGRSPKPQLVSTFWCLYHRVILLPVVKSIGFPLEIYCFDDQMVTFCDFLPELEACNTPHSAERPSLLYGSWREGASGPGRADAGVVGRCLGGRLSLNMSPHFGICTMSDSPSKLKSIDFPLCGTTK